MDMTPGPIGSSIAWRRLLAELGTIIVGVLIALAANAWWERRQEQNRAQEYLAQLLVDFQEADRRIRGAIESETQRVSEVSAVVDRALRGRLPPADSLSLPTGYNYFSPLVGTLTALIQSGDLRLLRSDSLRFQLIAYSVVVDDTETVLRHTENLVWNSTERLTLGRARHSIRAGRWGQIDVAGVLSDPDVISALQVQIAASQIRIFNIDRMQEPTSRIIELLQRELN